MMPRSCWFIRFPLTMKSPRELIQIHTAFIDLEDVDNIIIVIERRYQFDKVIALMDRAKSAGFTKINLAKLGG